MKRKSKLAIDALEAELEKISLDQMVGVLGGNYANINTDCVIEAIAFATGLPYNEVLDKYGQYMSGTQGGSTGSWEFDAIQTGVMYSNASSFAEYMGLTNVGDRPQGSSSQSISGDQSVAFLDYGNGSGHAVVLTGNAGPGSYYYYDPQNGTTGTLSANDPSIMQTYGY